MGYKKKMTPLLSLKVLVETLAHNTRQEKKHPGIVMNFADFLTLRGTVKLVIWVSCA